MSLNDLAKRIHKTAIDKGWWAAPREFGTLVALIHSEVSEALEAFRENGSPRDTRYKFQFKAWEAYPPGVHAVWARLNDNVHLAEDEPAYLPSGEELRLLIDAGVAKPEGVPSELADVIVRVLDIAEHYGIDMDTAVREKMRYNETRPHRHGGKHC